MNVRVITASAGTGKTHRLTQELERAIVSGRAHPEGVIATTFTSEAAAELVERARARLLQAGRPHEAQQLLAARIGTVNGVCGALVTEFAFELGLSPRLQVLDEAAADVELRRALAMVVSGDRAAELDDLRSRFEPEHDWRLDVSRIVEAARANGIKRDELATSSQRSCRDLDECLGPATPDDLDALLELALEESIAAVDQGDDRTKTTAVYLEKMRVAFRDLQQGRAPAWGVWATLAAGKTAKKSIEQVRRVQQIAERHTQHPRLRRDMHRQIELLFDAAGSTLAAYQEHKRSRSVIDFADQEVLALELLRRPDIRDALAGQIDLVLVDEFQDTSPIQLALFLELSNLAKESVWVGDPKQAIYAFRGTDPALMDAAIESLSSPRHDADLVEQAAAAVGQRVETLSVSYRSRPDLVAITSELFASAFAAQGVTEDRTRIVASVVKEPANLGPVFEYWPLDLDDTNAASRAASAAAGIRDLLIRAPMIRDEREGGDAVRSVSPGDLAILCRTNKQCREIAAALGALRVPAVVPRMNLLATPEAQVVRAGLALWLDPADALAAAELARIVSHPADFDGFLARVLETPGRDAFRENTTVVGILKARERRGDLGPVAALESIIDATDLRSLCAGWGDAAQRLANLDALRSHATVYCSEAAKSGRAATLSGLLGHFDRLAPQMTRWDQVRGDKQALLASDDQ